MAVIATINDLPVYNALIGENEGMLCVSLVDCPAVQSDFLAFSKDEKPLLFKVEDEDKRRVLGVIMRADYPIYRFDWSKGEFYMIFKPDVIREMAQKYLSDNNQNRVDLDHNGKMVKGVEMVQWFIKDTAKGVNPTGFDKIADGSLFAEYQVTDDKIWAEIKNGTYKGFSLEGFFSLVPETDGELTESMAKEYAGLFGDLRKEFKSLIKNNTTMAKLNKMKEALLEAAKRALLAFGTTTTDKGILAWDGEEDLKAGDQVFIDKDGERIPAEDGEYKTEDGKVIIVEGGAVKEIKDPEAEVSPAEEEEAAKKKKPCQAEEEQKEEPKNDPAPAEEPKEDDPKIKDLEDRLAKAEETIADLLSRIEAIEGKPAAEEAHQQYRSLQAKDNSNAVRLAQALRR